MVALIVRNRTIERHSEVSYDWYHAIIVSQKVPRYSHMVGVLHNRDVTRYWYCMNYNIVTLQHEHTRGIMGVSHNRVTE
jgi:hypothetical protein